MTSPMEHSPKNWELRLGIVLGTVEEECTAVVDGRTLAVPYASPFPRPRADRVDPGHLVAIATVAGGTPVVVWRWFDAVVVGADGPLLRLWDPHHGAVLARPRDPSRTYPPGSRAYASAGLPGAQWWVTGPTVAHAEDADVDLDDVAGFFTEHGLWERLV